MKKIIMTRDTKLRLATLVLQLISLILLSVKIALESSNGERNE